MDGYAAEIEQIKKFLRENPRGMTILNLSKELNISRNSAAKYLDVLLVSGQVEMESVGPAKIYYLSRRIPASALMNYSSDYMMVLDKELKVTQINDSFLQMLGFDRKTAIEKYIDDPLFLFFSDPTILSKIKDALKGNNYKEILNISKAGKESIFEIKLISSTLDNGSPGVSIFMKDVTEEKKMEQKLNKYHKLLDELDIGQTEGLETDPDNVSVQGTNIEADVKTRRKNAKNQAILNAMPDMIFTISSEGVFLDCVSPSDDCLFVPPSEFLNKKVAEVLPESLSEQFMSAIEQALLTNELQTIQYPLPVKGKIIYYEGRIVASKEDEVIAIITDITERKQAEMALLAAKLEAEAANRTKTEFLVTMNHELRTLLNSIIGFSDAMLGGLVDNLESKHEHYLNHISDSGHHMLNLINGVLDTSRIETGTIELFFEDVDVGYVIREIVTLVEPFSSKKEIDVDIDMADNIPHILADKAKFKQILYNLVGNAIKFAGNGGRVLVHAEINDQMLRISVIDTGIGISEDNQDKLLTPFSQVESSISRKYDGTELEFIIVKEFVEMHGGRIWVESESGKGSNFTFEIPVD